MSSELHALFYEKTPRGGYQPRLRARQADAWEVYSATASFRSQMQHTIRAVSSLISIATDEDDEAAPSDKLISECAWGLSGLAELTRYLNGIEVDAFKLHLQGEAPWDLDTDYNSEVLQLTALHEKHGRQILTKLLGWIDDAIEIDERTKEAQS